MPLAACTPAQCSRPVVASALPSGQVQAFGTKKVGDVVTFNVPPGTGSFTIVEQAQLATLSITYKNALTGQLRGPADDHQARRDGGLQRRHLAERQLAGRRHRSVRALRVLRRLDAEHGRLHHPGRPALPWMAASPQGTGSSWSATTPFECTILTGCNDGGTTENTYDVSVVTRGAPGATMDVAFYIATDAFTEANAPNDPSVQRMVSTFKAIYQQAGITANVVFHDLSATDKARFGTNISATVRRRLRRPEPDVHALRSASRATP